MSFRQRPKKLDAKVRSDTIVRRTPSAYYFASFCFRAA